MRQTGGSLPRTDRVKTPFMEGLTSSESDDASSSHSCELDLAIVGEAPGQMKRSQQTAIKMKKLKVPEPSLKLVKDFCFQGMTKASQKLSFATNENSVSKGCASFTVPQHNSNYESNTVTYEQFNFDSLLDMHPGLQSKTTNATSSMEPFVLSPAERSIREDKRLLIHTSKGYESLAEGCLDPNTQIGAHLIDRSPFLSGDEQFLGFYQNERSNPSKKLLNLEEAQAKFMPQKPGSKAPELQIEEECFHMNDDQDVDSLLRIDHN